MKMTLCTSEHSQTTVRFSLPARIRAGGLAMAVAASLGAAAPLGFALEQEAPYTSQRLAFVMPSTRLIGEKVLDRDQTATVGRIDELMLNLANSQVVVALVSSGGNAVTPVPAQSFLVAAKAFTTVGVSRGSFDKAPQLARANASMAWYARSLAKSFEYFSQAAPQVSEASSANLISSGGVRGMRLLSQANEPLGLVQDVVVDLPVGKIVYLVVQPGMSQDRQSQLYLVPPSAVRADLKKRTLVLNGDRAHFLAGRSFQWQFPSEMCLPYMAEAVYAHYDQGQPSSLAKTAVAQSAPTKADELMSKAIWDEILRSSDGIVVLSIKITTVNGKVTLTGKVKDAKQEQLIVSAANRVAGAGHVANQLVLPGKSKTATL